jgi:hypothetical protein
MHLDRETALRPALVAFRDRTELAWLRVLRPGFRHCAVWVRVGDFWIGEECLSHRTELSCVPVRYGRALESALRRDGARVVRTFVRAAPRRLAPPLPFTCVEAAKRALGIHAWRILTPFQLYRHLVRTRRTSLLTVIL